MRDCDSIESYPLTPTSERPTEYVEDDVFVMESRYNESDKELRKVKGLKVGCN